MNLATNDYSLRLQPNPNRTLGQIGSKSETITLNDEEVAGILLMAWNLFGSKYREHIMITIYGNNQRIELVAEDYINQYLVIKAAMRVPYNEDIESWYEYIDKLSATKNIITPEITLPYTCRFKNGSDTTIVQFELVDFLRGAIGCCKWFQYNWKDFIDQIHEGEASLSLNFVDDGNY